MSYASAMTKAGVELPILQPGDSGPVVSALQTLLAVSVTGVFDTATQTALQNMNVSTPLHGEGWQKVIDKAKG